MAKKKVYKRKNPKSPKKYDRKKWGIASLGSRLQLDEEKILNDVSKALLRGSAGVQAGQAAGIPQTTYTRWLSQGRVDIENEEDTCYSRFAFMIEEAGAGAANMMASALFVSGQQGDSRAQIEWLRRRFPQHWEAMPNTRTEIVLAKEKSDDEEAVDILEALRSRRTKEE